jgi:hypothetical protein
LLQFFEYRHDWREIWIDGRELPALEDTYPKWNGFSVGRWEDDTLVVESVGFDDRSWLDKLGYPHSEEMRLEERYRRVDADSLELTMTVTDPSVYSKPFHSDRKLFELNRDKAGAWDEQIYCIPAEEMSYQDLHKFSQSFAIGILISTASACTPANDDAERATEAERQQALRDSAFGSMVEPLDRARGVEQLTLDRKRELDAALESEQN